MNPRARRLLSWTFILTFFIIAPVIILSTAGYTYNFAKHRIERTGVMIVSSRPTGAGITLNGEPQKPLTPARLPNLSPGAYDLRVEKPGYFSWEKSVTVESRSTTFLNEVDLFKREMPLLFSPIGASVQAAFSPGSRYAAAISKTSSGSELSIVDLKTGIDILPYRSTSSADSFRLSWSRDGSWLLISLEGKKPSLLLWNSSDPAAVRDLREETGLAFDTAFWAQDDARLYGQTGGAIYEISPENLTAVAEGPSISEAVVAGATLYGIDASTPAKLVRRKLGDSSFEPIAELPSAAFKPLTGVGVRVAYVSMEGPELFVIDPSGNQPKAFEARGKDGAWSQDGNRLLYWNDLELRVYDAKYGSDDLITRLSGPISQAAWHQPEWSALYTVNGGLFATEITDRFGRLTLPLAGFTSIERFSVNSNGDYAYVFGNKDGQAGLWKLRLR